MGTMYVMVRPGQQQPVRRGHPAKDRKGTPSAVWPSLWPLGKACSTHGPEHSKEGAARAWHSASGLRPVAASWSSPHAHHTGQAMHVIPSCLVPRPFTSDLYTPKWTLKSSGN